MTPLLLALALLLDAAAGEPRWLWSRLPHPAVLMGRAIGLADWRWNKGTARRMKGALALAGLVLVAVLPGLIAGQLPLAPVWEVLIAAILLAQRSLCDHVGDVARALQLSPHEGRIAVARIVGRDTAEMTEADAARAAIESAAENLSDGVIAPAFWFLLLGLPGILAYKMVNTADSMIGHRTPRHLDFGWAAARTDDVLNLIPARLTALLLWLARPRRGAFRIIRRDAPLHRSPNAGWPEAAMAAALDTALSGPRSYHGQRRDYPFVHPEGDRHPGPATILAAVRMLWRAWALALAGAMLMIPFAW